MSAISKLLSPLASNGPLRPFDPRRDLAAVADLVEVCFADTLDEGGRDYLHRMRTAANSSGLASWTGLAAGLNGSPLAGYVWQEDGLIVGNASLIPYFNQGRWFYLIANIAVLPQYRRRGIARQLTTRAIQHARQHHSPAVWLHVRQENEGAVNLYRSLGFRERARRTSWVNNSVHIPFEPPPGIHITSLHSAHWDSLHNWLEQIYPSELTWHMPFNTQNLRPDLWGALIRFFYDAYIIQWAAVQNEKLLAALAWQSGHGSTNHFWLAAPTSLDEDIVRALLVHARRHLPNQRPVTLDFPANRFNQAIRDTGFNEQQTLIWMSLAL
jgi:ribosomal protein S18 acetylase RimI-like enzyme